MLTDIYDIQAYAKTLTKHAKTADGKSFQVLFKDGLKAPYTKVTPNTIEIGLPTPNDRMTERDVTMARWFMIHEISHHTEGHEIFNVMNENGLTNPEESPLAAVLNCFEDGRIEKSDAKKYQGDAKVFSNAMDIFANEQVTKFKKHGFPEDPEMQKMGACIVADLEARADWNYGAANNYHDYEEQLPPEGRAALKKLRDAGMIDVLRNLRSEQDTLDAAKKAYEIVWEDDPDKHIEEQKQKQQSKGDGKEGQDGEGKGQQGKGNKGQGKEQGGKKGEDSDGDSKDGERINELRESGKTVDYLELLNSKVPTEDTKASASGITLDYSNYLKGNHSTPAYEPTPLKDIRVVWFHKKKYSHKRLDEEIRNSEEHTSIKDQLDSVHKTHGIPGKGFGNKVRRHLQVLSQARYVGGHKSGRLHRKSAYKIGVPTVGNGEWNSRVFRQKHQQDMLDIAVCVLTDFSGSMYGSKVAHAIDSAMLLNKSIGTSLHIPLQLLTFTDYGRDAFIGVVKDFDERLPDEDIEKYMCQSGSFMSGNPDGDAILWAHRSLMQRKEKRKLLIVLSDGSPASSRPGDDMKFVCNVVKEIENEGVVEIVGLGIMDRNVKHIYSQNETIKKASELEHAVLNLVKKQIIK